MKKILLICLLLNACSTVNIREFEDIMTEEEKLIFLFTPLLYDLHYDECYIMIGD